MKNMLEFNYAMKKSADAATSPLLRFVCNKLWISEPLFVLYIHYNIVLSVCQEPY